MNGVAEDGAPPAAASADRRLGLLIDAVTEYAIFLLDPDGLVATWNVGAERIKGYRAEEIIGSHFSVFYPEEDVAEGKPPRELAEAIEHGQYREEGWRVRKDGSLFWANVVITPILGPDGVVTGFAKITRDDTDRELTREQAATLERLHDREVIAAGLHHTVVSRVFEACTLLEGATTLTKDPDVVRRIDEAVALLDATMKHIRLVALGLASDEGA